MKNEKRKKTGKVTQRFGARKTVVRFKEIKTIIDEAIIGLGKAVGRKLTPTEERDIREKYSSNAKFGHVVEHSLKTEHIIQREFGRLGAWLFTLEEMLVFKGLFTREELDKFREDTLQKLAKEQQKEVEEIKDTDNGERSLEAEENGERSLEEKDTIDMKCFECNPVDGCSEEVCKEQEEKLERSLEVKINNNLLEPASNEERKAKNRDCQDCKDKTEECIVGLCINTKGKQMIDSGTEEIIDK